METQIKNRTWWKTPWLWACIVVVVVAAAAVVMGLPALSAESAVTPETENVVAVEKAAKTIAAQVETETILSADEVLEVVTQVVADVPSSENCIACHTDQELLVQIAEAPEEVHSEEAEGEG